MSEEIKETVTEEVTEEVILYSVVLDELNRFTGIYSDLGDIDGSVKVKSLPNETDKTKMRFYQLVDPSLDYPWLFLEDEYRDFIEETNKIALEKKKNNLISRSKTNLKNYLDTHTLTSKCHRNTEKEYNITSEKQMMLTTVIFKAKNDTAFQPYWNASGESTTYDWTVGELQQLSDEIEDFVRPLVDKQQDLEVVIKNAETLEDLEMIDITFE